MSAICAWAPATTPLCLSGLLKISASSPRPIILESTAQTSAPAFTKASIKSVLAPGPISRILFPFKSPLRSVANESIGAVVIGEDVDGPACWTVNRMPLFDPAISVRWTSKARPLCAALFWKRLINTATSFSLAPAFGRAIIFPSSLLTTRKISSMALSLPSWS